MAVDARGKPSAVFQGPVGAFCASTGPAASTASSPVYGSGSFGLSSIEKQVDLRVVPRGDRRS
jgi:hypothetical protein